MAFAQANSITTIKKPLVYYRVNAGKSLEDTKDETPLIFWEANLLLKEKLEKLNLLEKTKQSFINSTIARLASNLRMLKTGKGFKLVFDKVKEIANSELEFEKHNSNYFYNKDETQFILDIVNSENCLEYLFNNWKSTTKNGRIVIENGANDVSKKGSSNIVQEQNLRTNVFLLKKIKGGIRCYKDHGIKYTFKRALEHLGIPMGIELYRN